MAKIVHLIPRGREEDFYSISGLIKETLGKATGDILLRFKKNDPVACKLANSVKENIVNDPIESASVEKIIKVASKKNCSEIIILCGSIEVPSFIYKISEYFKITAPQEFIPMYPKEMATFNGKEWIKRYF